MRPDRKMRVFSAASHGNLIKIFLSARWLPISAGGKLIFLRGE
jgi:hypothetical protein